MLDWQAVIAHIEGNAYSAEAEAKLERMEKKANENLRSGKFDATSPVPLCPLCCGMLKKPIEAAAQFHWRCFIEL